MRRALRTASVLVLLTTLGTSLPAGASPETSKSRPARLSGELRAALSTTSPGERLPVVITLRGTTPRTVGSVSVSAGLRRASREARSDLMTTLAAAAQAGRSGHATPLWIANAVSVPATPALIRSLARRPDVVSIRPDAVSVVPAATTAEVNIATAGAPPLWNQGIDGSGVVVASLDSGVDVSHPDLAGSFRGTPGSWFDPYGQHTASPVDLTGHGTGTIGVVVGGGSGGTAIGMAPGARWIAARIWNDAGSSSLTAIHQAFQWVLDPDGVASTADAPDVVNLSWSLGTAPACDLALQPDLQALRAANILPVVAAGNFGPSTSTSVSPANYPEALAVGAVNASDGVWSGSGRGPTTCGGSTGVYPELVAPGVAIRTADRFGLFQTVTGTSIAAPHAAGAAALLLSAHPSLGVDRTIAALTGAAADLGAAGPDDVYGYGRLDVAAGEAWLAAHPPASVDLSISAAGSHDLGSVTVRDEDVVAFDGSSYSMVFDGSDVGVTGEVDAFARLDGDSFLISLGAAGSVPGIATVDDSDVVRFDAASSGDFTAGTFSMYLDGSDMGLTTDGEDVDAVDVLPDGRIVLSLSGKGSVPAITTIQDEDLIALSATSLGRSTAGTITMYLDGSDVGLATSNSEDVDAVSIDLDGSIVLSTVGAVKVAGMAGTGDDALSCRPSSLGATSACTFSAELVLDGTAGGLAGLGLDAIERT